MHSGLRVRALAVACAGVCAAAACGGTSGTGGTSPASPDKQILRVNIDTEPSTLDPTQQQWVYEADVGRNTFEALTRAKGDLSDVEGAAAQSWTISPDGLTWTFKIRPDEKYSDGTAVTAGDFVYAYKRILDPRIAAPYTDPFFDNTIAGAQAYASIDPKNGAAVDSFLNGLGLSAPDDKTFVVKLQNPAPWFKWVTSLWLAAPLKKSEVDAVGSANFGAVSASAPSQIIGNGPFVISEIVPKDHITLTPNKYYRNPPKLQKVILEEITDGNIEFARFQNGELDITRGVPPADVASVKGDPKLSKEIVTGDSLLTWWIDFNTTKAPFNNPDLRMAFAKSIDRDSYVKNILKGIGTPIASFIPKGMPGYEPSTTQAFDCSAAKQLLSKAQSEGVTSQQLGSIHYEYSNSPVRKTTAEFFQQQWQTCLGVNVILDAVESKTHSQHLRELNYTIAGVQGWNADYPDGQDWFDIFLTGGGNQFNGWSNKAYDAAVQKGDTATSSADRLAAYSQAQKILEQDAPVIFVFQNEKFFLMSPKVQGAGVTPLDDDWAGDVNTTTTMYISA